VAVSEPDEPEDPQPATASVAASRSAAARM
jgi:hypothetical protein